jgi:hypothetical protein
VNAEAHHSLGSMHSKHTAKSSKSLTRRTGQAVLNKGLKAFALLLVCMILETSSQFTVQARMWTHSWGIPFGWADRLSCETELDSSVSNRASYFYMGGRTRSQDLVYGRRGS